MSDFFAEMEDVRGATAAVDIDAAIRCLNEGGSPEEAARLCPSGGPVILCEDDGRARVVDDDTHSITFASTGRGKTRRFIYPTLLTEILSGTNIVVNDMKGEIYATMRSLLQLAGYTVYVLDLRDPAYSPHRFNPLTLAWDEWHAGNADSAFLRLRNFGNSLFGGQLKERVDPFWPMSATDYFVGLALGMLEVGVSRDAFTIESVAAMDLKGERYAMNGTDDTYLERMFKYFPISSVALRSISGTIYAPHRTKESILSTFRQPIALYAGQTGLMDVLCRSDFSVEELSRPRRALFIISPDETHTLGPIVVGIVNQLASGFITLAQNEYGGILPNRVDFVLDEMGNLPARIPDLEALVSAARSRNIRFHFVLQSADQLTNVYGEELKNMVLDNCDTWVFMGSRGLPFLRYISELAGTVRLESGEESSLLSVDKLQHLEKRDNETEAVVFRSNLRPYIAALKDIGQYERPIKVAVTKTPHRRVAHEVFDIAEVKKKDVRTPPERPEDPWEQEQNAGDSEVKASRDMEQTTMNEFFSSDSELVRDILKELHEMGACLSDACEHNGHRKLGDVISNPLDDKERALANQLYDSVHGLYCSFLLAYMMVIFG